MNFFGLHTYPEGRPNAEPTVWIGPADEFWTGRPGRRRLTRPATSRRARRQLGLRRPPDEHYSFGARSALRRATTTATTCMEGPRAAGAQTPEAERTLFARAGGDARRRLRLRAPARQRRPASARRRRWSCRSAARAARCEAGGDAADTARAAALRGASSPAHRALLPDRLLLALDAGGLDVGGRATSRCARRSSDVRARSLAAAGPVKRAVHARHVRLGARPAAAGPHALRQRAAEGHRRSSCINRTVGHTPVERRLRRRDRAGRTGPSRGWKTIPALTVPQLWAGRHAPRRGRRPALRLHGPDRHPLAHARPRPERRGPGPGRLAAGLARCAGLVEGAIGGYPWCGRRRRSRARAGPGRLPRPALRARGLPRARAERPLHGHAALRRARAARAGERVFDVATRAADRDAARPREVARARATPSTSGRAGRCRERRLARRRLRRPPERRLPRRDRCRVAEGDPSDQRRRAGGRRLRGRPRRRAFVPTDDFWSDWAAHELGPEAAAAAATIFDRLDCRLPRPAAWIDGPGGLDPDDRPWSVAKADYAFVDALGALRPRVAGPRASNASTTGSRRSATCGRWASCGVPMRGCATRSPQCAPSRARPLDGRRPRPRCRGSSAEVPLAAEVMRHLFATVSTRGELGTVANWQQHVLPRVFEQPAREIEQALGRPLPCHGAPRPRVRRPRAAGRPDRPRRPREGRAAEARGHRPRRRAARTGAARLAAARIRRMDHGAVRTREPGRLARQRALAGRGLRVRGRGDIVQGGRAAGTRRRPRHSRTVVIVP